MQHTHTTCLLQLWACRSFLFVFCYVTVVIFIENDMIIVVIYDIYENNSYLRYI